MKKPKQNQPKEEQNIKKPDERVNKIVEKHLDNINDVMLIVLANCLASDLKFYDVSYVNRRIIQVIEDAIPNMDFKFPELEKLLRDYYMKKLEELKSKAHIGIYDSNTREAKSEPIVHTTISLIASPEFLEKDKEWLDSYLEETSRMFVVDLLKHEFEALFTKMDFSLEQSFIQAQNKLWGVAKAELPLKSLDEILKQK